MSESISWKWIKKTYSAKVAAEKLQNPSYHLIEDLGGDKVLCFRYPLVNGILGGAYTDVTDSAELAICDAGLDKARGYGQRDS